MKVNYPSTILNKSLGINESEKYLYKLCKETFLSFWSFPNLFRDQGRPKNNYQEKKGTGKEICDLLVIFENHIFIFSDKYCKFPKSGNIEVDWSRWYKKTIKESANQIYGAERWLFKYPNNIYLDKYCTKKFPFEIPKIDDAIIHRIIVAHGSSKECREYFGGSGSLMIFPKTIGNMHIKSERNTCLPFRIGQVDPKKGFVHVLDDTSLEIVMNTLDTISDFAKYLQLKEEFIRSGKLIGATGEEDLLAHYLKQTNELGEHVFINEKEDNVDLLITEGIWKKFSKHPSRLAQIEANKISYSWDKLLEKFFFNITNGTSYKMSDPDIEEQERLFRILAKENRTKRRMLAESIHELIEKTPLNMRTIRVLCPQFSNETCYLILLVPFLKNIPYENYRKAREVLLNDYLFILRSKFQDAKDIIGVATETGDSENRSEDIAYFDGRI